MVVWTLDNNMKTIKLVKIIHNENNGKEYGENSALFIEEISENVAVLRYKDF